MAGDSDNELKSVQLMADYHISTTSVDIQTGAMPPDLLKATQMILVTKNHVPHKEEQAIVRDLDMFGFSSYKTYCKNEPLIRAEFAHLTDAEYKKGKLGFLYSLTKQPVFYSDYFKHLNGRAMAVVMRAIQDLECGISC